MMECVLATVCTSIGRYNYDKCIVGRKINKQHIETNSHLINCTEGKYQIITVTGSCLSVILATSPTCQLGPTFVGGDSGLAKWQLSPRWAPRCGLLEKSKAGWRSRQLDTLQAGASVSAEGRGPGSSKGEQ